MNIFLFLAMSISFLFGAYPKEKDILLFLDAKFSGDTTTVRKYLSSEFTYFHAPFVGLGIKAFFVDGALLITDISNDSLTKYLSIGDRIHEFNGNTVTSDGISIMGAAGEVQELIVTKKDSLTFSTIQVPLHHITESENATTFLEKIKQYSNLWYNYDFKLNEFFSKKGKIFIHYTWEGALEQNSNIYYFDAFEILTTDRKSGQILTSRTLWNELQFKNQFK